MPRFSRGSKEELETCHPELQYLLNEAIHWYDFTVIQGARTEEEQRRNVEEGVSQTMNSKHLLRPSEAVDIAPYPIDWQDAARFYHLAGYIQRLAHELVVPIIWGGSWESWPMNGRPNMRTGFKDLGHFELE